MHFNQESALSLCHDMELTLDEFLDTLEIYLRASNAWMETTDFKGALDWDELFSDLLPLEERADLLLAAV